MDKNSYITSVFELFSYELNYLPILLNYVVGNQIEYASTLQDVGLHALHHNPADEEECHA